MAGTDKKLSSVHMAVPAKRRFYTLKTLIILKFYNVTQEATIHCDVSERGLGATLLQKGQPVAFASCSLTPSEQNYAQIEKVFSHSILL